MALICMAVHDTDDNYRSDYTDQTMISILDTADFKKHSLVVIDNGSCSLTKRLLERYRFITDNMTVITLKENVGTAKAVNMGIILRKSGEHVIKIDNDVCINQSRWVEQMEEVISRDPTIGIVGLKRKDLAEWPLETGWAQSNLLALPHLPGQTWVSVEQVNHVMGTCQMLSSALLDKIGGFSQPSQYGFDDSLLSLRSSLAGFKNVFLSHIDIDHLDEGGTEYSTWKHQHAGENMEAYNKMCEQYKNGERTLYEEI